MKNLLKLLKEDIPDTMTTRDFGDLAPFGVAKICVLSLRGDLLIAFFAYSGDEHGESIKVRLIYDEGCQRIVGDILAEYDERAIFEEKRPTVAAARPEKGESPINKLVQFFHRRRGDQT
jgi:hypothetical protein